MYSKISFCLWNGILPYLIGSLYVASIPNQIRKPAKEVK